MLGLAVHVVHGLPVVYMEGLMVALSVVVVVRLRLVSVSRELAPE